MSIMLMSVPSHSFATKYTMSESGSEQNKAEKKRAYNRNAQRVFRQRRKEHLTKLEQAQHEAQTAQSEEVQRLRHENQALLAENETLRAGYASHTTSPVATLSPTEVRNTATNYLPYGPPSAFLEAAGTRTPVAAVVPSTPAILQDSSNMVVVMPNNIAAIRRSLHRLFAPILDVSVISNPHNHLATLQALRPTLPIALKPTQLQLTTPHHAYIDMIPSPSLRDRLISIGGVQANTFLMEVCTLVHNIEDTGQMTVWGEDWLNEFSWEFSAAALERYGPWLLTPEWGQRANFWRRQRGAECLPGYD